GVVLLGVCLWRSRARASYTGVFFVVAALEWYGTAIRSLALEPLGARPRNRGRQPAERSGQRLHRVRRDGAARCAVARIRRPDADLAAGGGPLMSQARRPENFDAIVVGAGPAGSACAYFLASGGLPALLVDRATFPRDKPCGGGVTARAAALLPFSLEPVVEEVVEQFEFGLSYRKRFARRSEQPLVLMTERMKLDAFLVSRAI